ncbi:amino acid racemase [Variovorax sp. LjRoot290]|uniref:amino acid racemase n=1 Tax=Variovorax sp. LjRoot290 TaxID=3342316 RepID=UPI003ED017A0
MTPRLRSLLVVGRPEHLGAADIAAKMEAICAAQAPRKYRVVLDPDSAFEDAPATCEAEIERGKIALFDSIWRMDDTDLAGVLLPTIESHRFASELAPVSETPIVSMLDALAKHVSSRYPRVRRIGVLASASVKSLGLFESRFDGGALELIYPRATALRELTATIETLSASSLGEYAVSAADLQAVERAYDDLADQGAELVLVGSTVLCVAMDSLHSKAAAAGLAVVDSNQVYAEFAAEANHASGTRPFKIGVLGGVGPAATVSFLDKLVRATPAARDQDHLKFVVEQNPQIPDRTEYLIRDGLDPTLALYATCKKLQDADADIIAIPCNTAHAFVKYIQPMLDIPIVHMLRETVEFITREYAGLRNIGLLATTGTVASRVYHDEIERAMRQVTTPEPVVQQQIMEVIYGPGGVKAGFLDDHCRAAVEDAIGHLVRSGAEVVILGCTELPLLIQQNLDYEVQGKRVPVIDPAQVLARRCIEFSQSAR